MKRCLLVMGLLWLAVAHAVERGTEGHGGDPLAAEFVARGYEIYAKLSDAAPSNALLTQGQLLKLEGALRSTQIELTNDVLHDPRGGIVTSLVEPDPTHPGQQKLRINKPALQEVWTGKIKVNRFVLHEYLRLAGIDDDHYQISGRFEQDYVIPDPHVPTPKPVHRQTISFVTEVFGEKYAAPEPVEAEVREEFEGGNPASVDYAPYWDCRQPKKVNSPAYDQAEESYQFAFLNWTADIKKQFYDNQAASVLDVSYSPHQIYGQPLRTEIFGAARFEKMKYSYGGSKPAWACPPIVGFQFQRTFDVNVVVDQAQPIQLFNSDRVTHYGKAYTYSQVPTGTGEAVVAAFADAHHDAERVCREWQAEVKKRLGDRLIYASCGPFELIAKFVPDVPQGVSVAYGFAGAVFFTDPQARK